MAVPETQGSGGNTQWQMVDGVLQPVETAAPQSEKTTLKPQPIPQYVIHAKRPAYTTQAIGVWRNDAPALQALRKAEQEQTATEDAQTEVVLPTDSLATDSVVTESVPVMVMSNTLIEEADPEVSANAQNGNIFADGMSWIYLCMGLLFCAVAVKFRNNKKYLGALIDDLTETRVRHNAFDETVKETSFLLLLNIMWIASAGVLLWQGIVEFGIGHNALPILGQPTGGETLHLCDAAKGIGVCMGATAVYAICMILFYWMVGNVFTTSQKTNLWVKGALASSGLETIALFPLALVSVSYEPWSQWAIWGGVLVFVLGKLIFIYKGFRIFFNQISSCLLFLYYLCSVEIVPLILLYLVTLRIVTLI